MRRFVVVLLASAAFPAAGFAADDLVPLSSVTISRQAVEGILSAQKNATVLNAPLEGVGSGFDIFTGELQNPECVKFGSLSDDNEEENGIQNPSFFHQIYSISQFCTESEIGASASLTYKAFSGSFSHQQLNGSYFNSYDHYAIMYSKVTIRSKTLKTLELTDPARELLAAGDVKGFRQRCGDAFVKGYDLGGVFSAVIHIHNTDDAKWKESKTTISAGISGLLGGHFEQGSAYETMVKNADVTTEFINKGGVEADPTPENAREYLRNFRVKAKGNPVRVAYVTAPYTEIFDPAVDQLPKLTQQMLEAVSVLAEKREAARQTLNDLEFALAHPTIFDETKDTPATIGTKKTLVQTYLQAVAKAVDSCQQATTLDACKVELGGIGEPPRADLTEKP